MTKCRDLVEGVGDIAAGYWHKGDVAVHFRCPLTPAEMERLPAGWLACAAVDMGGMEDRMTRDPPW